MNIICSQLLDIPAHVHTYIVYVPSSSTVLISTCDSIQSLTSTVSSPWSCLTQFYNSYNRHDQWPMTMLINWPENRSTRWPLELKFYRPPCFAGSVSGCGFPGAPAHSTVTFSPSDDNAREGTIAEYSCDRWAVTMIMMSDKPSSFSRGFELLGPARRVCGSNGTWSPQGIPFCGQFFYHNCCYNHQHHNHITFIITSLWYCSSKSWVNISGMLALSKFEEAGHILIQNSERQPCSHAIASSLFYSAPEYEAMTTKVT